MLRACVECAIQIEPGTSDASKCAVSARCVFAALLSLDPNKQQSTLYHLAYTCMPNSSSELLFGMQVFGMRGLDCYAAVFSV